MACLIPRPLAIIITSMGSQQSTHPHPRTNNRRAASRDEEKRYGKSYQTLFVHPSLDQLKTSFSQSRYIAQGLFNLFSSVNDRSYESFCEIIFFLTKLDIDVTINRQLRQVADKTTIMDRFFMLLYRVDNLKAYGNVQVAKEDKQNCIFEFFSLFCSPHHKNLVKTHEIIDNFEQKEALPDFAQKLKNTFYYSQKMIITFFTQKFSNPDKRFQIFSEVPDSNLLSIEDWLMLGMKNAKILKNQPKLLYSLQKNGSSFHTLYRQLIGYQGPWILVLSHYQTDAVSKQIKLCILGSFQGAPVQDVGSYQGNSQSFLFRLSPHQRYFTAAEGEGESNYFKINTTQSEISKLPRGIGFGGRDNNNYKIWIDQQIERKSYVGNKEDPTYGYGYIAFPATNTLKVRDLQIWGLGDEYSLQQREQYWQKREQEAYKRRKVNKKDLISGGGLTSLLFQNTFKHREQVIGEIEHKKDEEYEV